MKYEQEAEPSPVTETHAESAEALDTSFSAAPEYSGEQLKEAFAVAHAEEPTTEDLQAAYAVMDERGMVNVGGEEMAFSVAAQQYGKYPDQREQNVEKSDGTGSSQRDEPSLDTITGEVVGSGQSGEQEEGLAGEGVRERPVGTGDSVENIENPMTNLAPGGTERDTQEANIENASEAEDVTSAEVAEIHISPEQLRAERRTAIIKELEEEWEARNGPMERQMTQAEIRNLSAWETMHGREWDGGTKRMTDAASEFYFDHRGMGKNSVPKRADKILVERFPEYANRPQEQQKTRIGTEASEAIANDTADVDTRAPEQRGYGSVGESRESLQVSDTHTHTQNPARGLQANERSQETSAALTERGSTGGDQSSQAEVMTDATMDRPERLSGESVDTLPLEARPIIDSAVFRDAELGLDEAREFTSVDVTKIVGRPSADQWRDGWAHEYEARAGRIDSVEAAIRSGDPQLIENIFHTQKPDERIKLSAYDGPAGPMYGVEDGTHRVAGSMRAGLEEIPASVRRIKFPFSFRGRAVEQAQDIRSKIALGMIDGEIQETKDEHGEPIYTYVIRHEVLPWLHTTSQRDLIKISRMYEQLYPGTLNDLPIPRDALVDPIANNYYMAGKWPEWETQFKDNERDEQGIVRYDQRGTV